MAKRRKQAQTRPPVSLEKYGGLWIAWNKKITRIVGSGRTFDEAIRAAERAGELKPVLEKVLPLNWSLRGLAS